MAYESKPLGGAGLAELIAKIKTWVMELLSHKQDTLPTSGTASDTYAININGNAETATGYTSGGAIDTQIENLRSEIVATNTALNNEVSARASGDTALSSDIDSLSNSLSATNTALNNEASTRASQDAAILSSVGGEINTLSVELANTNSSLQSCWRQVNANTSEIADKVGVSPTLIVNRSSATIPSMSYHSGCFQLIYGNSSVTSSQSVAISTLMGSTYMGGYGGQSGAVYTIVNNCAASVAVTGLATGSYTISKGTCLIVVCYGGTYYRQSV